jgi:DNA modification methylase
MVTKELILDQIMQGDCIEVLNSLPEKSVDLILQFTVTKRAVASKYD